MQSKILQNIKQNAQLKSQEKREVVKRMTRNGYSDKQSGKWMYLSKEDKFLYIGEFRKGQFHGKGVKKYQSGDQHSGNFYKNVINGNANEVELIYGVRQSYVCNLLKSSGYGYFANNKLVMGITYFPDKSTHKYFDSIQYLNLCDQYAIEPIDPKQFMQIIEIPNKTTNFVQCNIRYNNGDHYIGETLQNKKHGFGKIREILGSQYIGYFVEDMKQGFGIKTTEQGQKVEGIWYKNRLEGWTIITQTNGNTYKGYDNGVAFSIINNKIMIGNFVQHQIFGDMATLNTVTNEFCIESEGVSPRIRSYKITIIDNQIKEQYEFEPHAKQGLVFIKTKNHIKIGYQQNRINRYGMILKPNNNLQILSFVGNQLEFIEIQSTGNIYESKIVNGLFKGRKGERLSNGMLYETIVDGEKQIGKGVLKTAEYFFQGTWCQQAWSIATY